MPGQVPKNLQSSAEVKHCLKLQFEVSPLMCWSREVGWGMIALTNMQRSNFSLLCFSILLRTGPWEGHNRILCFKLVRNERQEGVFYEHVIVLNVIYCVHYFPAATLL